MINSAHSHWIVSSVIIIQGTTVAILRQKLEEDEGKQVVTWSNGNIFRSVTLLAAAWCEQNGCDGFEADKALTKENIADFMAMLTFGKVRVMLSNVIVLCPRVAHHTNTTVLHY